jgi:hypothetical protein
MTQTGSIEMWLNRDEGQETWLLVNARMAQPLHARRMLLDSPLPLAEALHPLVADCLQRALARQHETAVLSDRDFLLDLGALRLRGLRILTRCPASGPSTATLRFLESCGDREVILAPALQAPRAAPPPVDALLAPVLQDLLCPALEVFDHILQHGLSEENARALAARVKTLRGRRDALSDYIALLSRVVAEAGAAAPQTLGDPAPLGAVAGDLTWSPRSGLSRGDGRGILHGHAEALGLRR